MMEDVGMQDVHFNEVSALPVGVFSPPVSRGRLCSACPSHDGFLSATAAAHFALTKLMLQAAKTAAKAPPSPFLGIPPLL